MSQVSSRKIMSKVRPLKVLVSFTPSKLPRPRGDFHGFETSAKQRGLPKSE